MNLHNFSMFRFNYCHNKLYDLIKFDIAFIKLRVDKLLKDSNIELTKQLNDKDMCSLNSLVDAKTNFNLDLWIVVLVL